MKLNKGDQFVTVGDITDPTTISAPLTFEREDRDYFYSDGKSEGDSKNDAAHIHYKGFCFPVAFAPELRAICEHRRKLKDALDGSMSLVYDLRNRISRGELPKV